MNKQPELSPENPQKKGEDQASSTHSTITNQINGEANVKNLYPEIVDYPIIVPDNPYTINGGCNRKYNFLSKNNSFQINGKSHLDAIRNGFIKLSIENSDIYNRKRMTVNLQNNRSTKLHKYLIKIIPIHHPLYKYKIEFYLV